MVKLMQIEQEDFEIFLKRGIREYAEDHVRSGNWTAEEAYEITNINMRKVLRKTGWAN